MKIALSGKIGSGKSHLASLFQGAYGGERLSFADPVKDMFEKHEKVSLMFKSKRDYCQALGHGLREWNHGVWVDIMVDRLSRLRSDIAIIDDVRYPNELEALEEMGFKVIRVVNRETDRLKHISERDRGATVQSLVHPGELALDNHNFTYTFWNYYDDASEEKFLQFVKAVWRGD